MDKKLYRIVESGGNYRHEFLGKNRSPLFESIPNKDFGYEQKTSYYNFLKDEFRKLIFSYFPINIINYNNNAVCNVRDIIFHDPESKKISISEDDTKNNSITWSYGISLLWLLTWTCEAVKIPINDEEDIKNSIVQWVKGAFKIGDFTLNEKEKEKIWEIKEKKENLKILINLLEKEGNLITIKLYYEGEKEINICNLPKINSRGNFIINGLDKLVVFQSVRAPSVYFFVNNEGKIYAEIIPFKGSWINIFLRKKNSETAIDIEFLNSEKVFNFLDIMKHFNTPLESLKKMFPNEIIDADEYLKKEVTGLKIPQFIFTNFNHYFTLGKLGRKKFNRRSNLFYQLIGQKLAKDFLDKKGRVIFTKGTKFEEKEIKKLSEEISNNMVESILLPFSSNPLFSLEIESPEDENKSTIILGFNGNIKEEKVYFDLADLACVVSIFYNLHSNLGTPEKEETKDKLENQIVRQVGDLFYSSFENRLSVFVQNIKNKYLGYLSKFKKSDLTKLPYLKDFDNSIRNFFNTSPLVQLQNQNNPLSEISYTQKLSVLGTGGFSSSNTTFSARNINSSYYGRYDLVETPEGQRVGLIHNLAVGAKINEYGQIVVPYFLVKKGFITSNLYYLTSEEEKENYITHCDINISEKNEILDEELLVKFNDEFIWVKKEKINYIDSSFYQINSSASSTIPFFQHNDATRMLMATNMQRQAVPLFKSQEPWVASGIENNLANYSFLAVHTKNYGKVTYVDSRKIIIKSNDEEEIIYNIKQLVASNKNTLSFSHPMVKVGEKVKKGDIIANGGNYTKNNELALGYNLRVAYLCWKGYNFEDAIVLNEKLVRNDILTSFFVKKHVVFIYNTKHGPETLTSSIPYSEKKFEHLDDEGIVKIGSEVKEHDILVGKITPRPRLKKDSEEEEFLVGILGEKTKKFVDSSLYMPAGESGTVYEIKRKKILKNKKEVDLIEVYVVSERKISIGDKLTTRYGNKGIVAKIVPDIDMPFDEEGKTVDIIFNPLSVPTRMNIGQLLETIFAEVSFRINKKILVRPFNTISLPIIKEIIKEANIKNYGSRKLFDGQTGLPFEQNIYTGYIYTIKLNHMVDDKFHARNTGPYSLIYQQPLKGRSQGGGQRIGEMESWALEAHGASYNLMEAMGIKSDDIRGRKLAQLSIMFGKRQISLQNNRSESLNLLIQYLRGIGFDLEAFDHNDKEIDFYKYFVDK